MENLDLAKLLFQGVVGLEKIKKRREGSFFITADNEIAGRVLSQRVDGFFLAAKINDVVGGGVAANRQPIGEGVKRGNRSPDKNFFVWLGPFLKVLGD